MLGIMMLIILMTLIGDYKSEFIKSIKTDQEQERGKSQQILDSQWSAPGFTIVVMLIQIQIQI